MRCTRARARSPYRKSHACYPLAYSTQKYAKARLENESLKDLHAFSQEAANAAEQKAEDAEAQMSKQLKDNQALLESLLAKQRTQFEDELERFKREAWSRTEQEERERRVEAMRRQIFRRMMNQQLASGWASWADYWGARVHLTTMHSRAARHVQKASVMHAFYGWWHTWHLFKPLQ